MIYNINKNNAQDVLNEVYFGKEYILPLQNQLSIVRNKFKNKQWNYSINSDKDVLKFNRLCEKMFGFSTFALSIVPDQYINAYMCPLEANLSEQERRRLLNAIKASKNGFKFDPSMGQISVMIGLSMGTVNSYLTDQEMMACILHEIGHSFFEAVTDKDGIWTVASFITNAIRKVNKMIINRLSSGENVTDNDIENDMNNIKSFDLKRAIIKPFSILSNTFKKGKSKLAKLLHHEAFEDNMTRKMQWYTNEKFADTFASMYGYGPELHAALLKMAQLEDDPNVRPQTRNPILVVYRAYKMYIKDALNFVLGMQDEHPEGLTRIKVSCEYLKKEIAKESIDPKMKAQMVEQLDQLNRLIDEFINYPKDKDKIAIWRKYYILLYKKFGGDRRERLADNDALFDRIDDRYDELIK